MTRDLFYYIEADVATVYNAYLTAAQRPPFERDCHQEPYHTINWGMNFSMKYNMNGGSCILRFMPYGNGTAINIHFIVAQLAGARYERYAEDLNRALVNILPIAPAPIRLNADDFQRPENRITPANVRPAAPAPIAAPIAAPAPAPVAAPTPVAKNFCTNCGNKIIPNAKFCAYCGTKL